MVSTQTHPYIYLHLRAIISTSIYLKKALQLRKGDQLKLQFVQPLNYLIKQHGTSLLGRPTQSSETIQICK